MPEAKFPELIWLREQPARRRPRFSRQQITEAALKIADEEGFQAVTMQRLGAELGCGTMTLYHYVRGKADVVALMQDAILAELLLAEGELPADWLAAIAAIARRTREVLLRHPWSLGTLNDAHFGPNAMRHIEQSLACLDGLHLRPGEELSVLGVVDDYVVGSALHAVEVMARARAARESPGLAEEAIAFGRRQLATGQFPRLAELYRQGGGDEGHSPEGAAGWEPGSKLAAQFELGLRAMLKGLSAAQDS